jgi:hypothetical protein
MLLGGAPDCFRVSDNKRVMTRDEKVENLLFNYSMILMATFEAAFANLASTMTDALAKRAFGKFARGSGFLVATDDFMGWAVIGC